MCAVLFLEAVQAKHTQALHLSSLDHSKILWRNIILMCFYITCNVRTLSSKPYLKLFVVFHLDSCFDYVVCKGKTRTETKTPTPLLMLLPGYPVIKLKHTLSMWLLHLLLMDGDERNFGSILQLPWPEQLSKQREKCFDLLLVDTTMSLHEIYRIQSIWPMQHPHRQTQWENFYLPLPSQHCLNTPYRHCIEFWKRRTKLLDSSLRAGNSMLDSRDRMWSGAHPNLVLTLIMASVWM